MIKWLGFRIASKKVTRVYSGKPVFIFAKKSGGKISTSLFMNEMPEILFEGEVICYQLIII